MKRSLHLVSAQSLFNSSVAAFVIPSSEIYFCSSLGLLQLVLATKSRDVKLPWTVLAVAGSPGQDLLQVQLPLQTQPARAHPSAKADIPAPRKNSGREQDPCIISRNQILKSKSLF